MRGCVIIMKMECSNWICLLLVSVVCFIVIDGSPEQRILSRKKRYLVFPEGANFVVRLALNSALIGVKHPSNWFHIIELDLSYKLPNDKRYLRKKPQLYFYHRRDRRDVFDEITGLFNMHGEDGRACLLRAFCEVRHILPACEQKSLLEEILELVFTIPPGTDDIFSEDVYDFVKLTSPQDCQHWLTSCKVSLLDLMVTTSNTD